MKTLEDARDPRAVKWGKRLSELKLRSWQSWVQWLRWHRWSGMLGMASRSFNMAEHSLRHALIDATTAAAEPGDDPQHIEWSKLPICRMPAQWSGSGLQSLRVEALRCAEQYVSLELLMDGVRQRRLGLQLDGGLGLSQRDASLRTLGQIEAHIDWAQKLATTIRENDDSPARTTPSPPSGVRAGGCPSQRLQDSTRALGG